ncbi:MAG: hypothetical protein RSD88_06420 [Anaerovoracaceae bacterium]
MIKKINQVLRVVFIGITVLVVIGKVSEVSCPLNIRKKSEQPKGNAEDFDEVW